MASRVYNVYTFHIRFNGNRLNSFSQFQTAAEAAEQRIRSQMPNATRAARASVTIDSSGPKPETAAKLTKAAVALRWQVREEYGFDLVAGGT